MNEEDLRDCFAMFAMMGLIMKFNNETPIEADAYRLADRMLEARRVNEEPQGIVAIKKRRNAK